MDIIVFTVDIFNDVRTDLFQIFLGRCDRDKKKEKGGKKNDDSFHIEYFHSHSIVAGGLELIS